MKHTGVYACLGRCAIQQKWKINDALKQNVLLSQRGRGVMGQPQLGGGKWPTGWSEERESPSLPEGPGTWKSQWRGWRQGRRAWQQNQVARDSERERAVNTLWEGAKDELRTSPTPPSRDAILGAVNIRSAGGRLGRVRQLPPG